MQKLFENWRKHLNEEEQLELKNLDPYVDTIVSAVESELAKAPEGTTGMLVQAVISRLQDISGGEGQVSEFNYSGAAGANLRAAQLAGNRDQEDEEHT